MVMKERRQSARFDVPGGEQAIHPTDLSVRLLDISLTGVLVHARQTGKEGSRGRLRLDLAGQPLAAEVEVRRIAQDPGGQGYKIGARFVDLTDDQRHLIETFTRR
jgi:c-di-GMP-binding flagellar brake protein YcgR